MIIVEYVLDHPILRSTRTAVPGIEVAWENSHVGPKRDRQFLAWVECGDFEAALGADPTVTNTESITETDGRGVGVCHAVSGPGIARTDRSVLP